MDMSRVVCYVTPDMKCNKHSLVMTNDRKLPSWLESVGSVLWSNLVTALLFLLEWTVVVVILFQMFRLKKNKPEESLRKPTTPRLRKDTKQLSVIYEEEEFLEEHELRTKENDENCEESELQNINSLEDCEDSELQNINSLEDCEGSELESREDWEESGLRTIGSAED